jgi:hypothetical protein
VANGLGGLIGAGQQTKKQAFGGLLGSARMEAQQDIAERQLEMQKEASIQQMQGTALGIGAAVGASQVAALGPTATFGAQAAAFAGPVGWAILGAFALKEIFD